MATYTAHAGYCVDGMSTAHFERLSAKKGQLVAPPKDAKKGTKPTRTPLTVAEWRKSVVDTLASAKAGDPMENWSSGSKSNSKLTAAQAKAFQSAARALGPAKPGGPLQYDTPGDLDALLSGKVAGAEVFSGTKSAYQSWEIPMWTYLEKKGVPVYDAYWQEETGASCVETKTVVGPDGTTKTTRVPHYFPPDQFPWVTNRGSFKQKYGTFVKVTPPAADLKAGKKPYYARVLEGGPKKEGAEVSMKVWEGMGYTGGSPNAAPIDGNLRYDTVGVPSESAIAPYPGGYLSDPEIQLAGKLLEDGKARHINSKQELFDTMTKLHGDKARDEAKKAGVEFPEDMKATGAKDTPAPKDKKTAQRVLKGFPGVAMGEELRLVAYADPACVHEGGGFVSHGAHGVYVGKYPFARVGDATSDGKAIVSGAPTVFIGGPSTDKTLA